MCVLAPLTPRATPRLGTLFFLGLALLTTCSVTRGQAPAPQSKDGISKVMQCRLGGNVTVAKIESSPWKSGTTMDALLKLKPAGASEAVQTLARRGGLTFAPGGDHEKISVSTSSSRVGGGGPEFSARVRTELRQSSQWLWCSLGKSLCKVVYMHGRNTHTQRTRLQGRLQLGRAKIRRHHAAFQ